MRTTNCLDGSLGALPISLNLLIPPACLMIASKRIFVYACGKFSSVTTIGDGFSARSFSWLALTMLASLFTEFEKSPLLPLQLAEKKPSELTKRRDAIDLEFFVAIY